MAKVHAASRPQCGVPCGHKIKKLFFPIYMNILAENPFPPSSSSLQKPADKFPHSAFKGRRTVKETQQNSAQQSQQPSTTSQQNEELNQLSTRSKSSNSSFTDLFSLFHRKYPTSPTSTMVQGIFEQEDDCVANVQYFAHTETVSNFLRKPGRQLHIRNTDHDIFKESKTVDTEPVNLELLDNWDSLKFSETSSGSTLAEMLDLTLNIAEKPDSYLSSFVEKTVLVQEPIPMIRETSLPKQHSLTIYEAPLSPTAINREFFTPHRKTKRSKSIDFVFWPRPITTTPRLLKPALDPCHLAFQNFSQSNKSMHRLKSIVSKSSSLTRKKSESVRQLFQFGK